MYGLKGNKKKLVLSKQTNESMHYSVDQFAEYLTGCCRPAVDTLELQVGLPQQRDPFRQLLSIKST